MIVVLYCRLSLGKPQKRFFNGQATKAGPPKNSFFSASLICFCLFSFLFVYLCQYFHCFKIVLHLWTLFLVYHLCLACRKLNMSCDLIKRLEHIQQ